MDTDLATVVHAFMMHESCQVKIISPTGQTMSSRQEKRKLERDAKKGKKETPTTHHDWNSAHVEEQELAVSTDIRYLRAPRGLPNVRQNTQLRVLRAFLTPASCPHGAGLMCYDLGKFRAIDVPGKGFAWLQR